MKVWQKWSLTIVVVVSATAMSWFYLGDHDFGVKKSTPEINIEEETTQ